MSELNIKELYPFQKKIVDRFEKVNKVFLALDMGLGKTLTSLKWLSTKSVRNKPRKIYILTLPTKLLDWRDEIINMPEFAYNSVIILQHGKKKYDNNPMTLHKCPTNIFYITTYDIFIREVSISSKPNIDDILILDESHKIKSPQSKRGKHIVKLSRKFSYVAMLTGTPISNEYADIFNQLHGLGDNRNYYLFRNEFCNMREEKRVFGSFKVIDSYKDIDKLLLEMQPYTEFMETKEAIDLPKQVFEKIMIENTNQKVFDIIRKTRVYHDIAYDNPASLYSCARQIASGFISGEDLDFRPKLRVIEDLLESTGDSLIIYYNFNKELEHLKNMCVELDLPYYQINGHQNDYNELNQVTKRHILLIQFKAGSDSLNLQQYNRMIFYSLTNSYIEYAQSIKRIHRIGTKNTCFYYYFIVKNSIEEDIYYALQNGKSYSTQMFESKFLSPNRLDK